MTYTVGATVGYTCNWIIKWVCLGILSIVVINCY